MVNTDHPVVLEVISVGVGVGEAEAIALVDVVLAPSLRLRILFFGRNPFVGATAERLEPLSLAAAARLLFKATRKELISILKKIKVSKRSFEWEWGGKEKETEHGGSVGCQLYPW